MILDRLGMLGSTVCAIHCALPLLLSFISPSISSFFENEKIHYSLLAIVILLAMFSFLKSRAFHMKNGPFFLGFVGILFLIAAVSVEQPFGLKFNHFEFLTTVAGSSILILSHFLNLQLIRGSKFVG